MQVPNPPCIPNPLHNHVPVALPSDEGGTGARAGVALVPGSGQRTKAWAFGLSLSQSFVLAVGQPVLALTRPSSPRPCKAVRQTFWVACKRCPFENWENLPATGLSSLERGTDGLTGAGTQPEGLPLYTLVSSPEDPRPKALPPPLNLGGDLPRPRLEMVSRSVKLLASRMACGSLSVKGSKSLWRQERPEVMAGRGTHVSIPGPRQPCWLLGSPGRLETSLGLRG